MDPDTVAAVLVDWERAPVSGRLRAGLAAAHAMTRRPADITPPDLQHWRNAGLDDHAIEDVANIALHFNFINRVADAFDFPLVDETIRSRHTRFLSRVGNIFRAKRPQPSFAAGSDGLIRPVEVNDGRDRMLAIEGATQPETRQAVEAYTARLLGGARPPATPPNVLTSYLDKLTRHAYRIVDSDIDRLRSAGFDDEAIYEVTLVGALGASLVGVERVFQLLYG